MTVTLTRLRGGDDSAPLFLFPGAGADPREMEALAKSTRCGREVLGVDFLGSDDCAPDSLTVEAMADACCGEIRRMQRRGPYFLVGYSFGGLVAIEVARLLRSSGEEIGLLGIIDTIFCHRHWPKRLFLGSQAKRAWWHLRRIATLPPRQAAAELGRRTRRLILRLRYWSATSEPLSTVAALDHASPQERCTAAAGRYAPSHYPGKLVVFKGASDTDFGCDLMLLWRGLAQTLESDTIGGSHLGIVRDESSTGRLAAALDARL
jgi:thioesterase domain-containing protein